MTNNKKQDIQKKKFKVMAKHFLISAEVFVTALFCALFLVSIYYFIVNAEQGVSYVKDEPAPTSVVENKIKRKVVKTITAKVTGYNTVPEQTDSTPCIASSGQNICGRKDVVACPRSMETNTIVEIMDKEYKCLDVLALKYDNRFDVSCDKDMQCPYKFTGVREVKIIKYE